MGHPLSPGTSQYHKEHSLVSCVLRDGELRGVPDSLGEASDTAQFNKTSSHFTDI